MFETTFSSPIRHSQSLSEADVPPVAMPPRSHQSDLIVPIRSLGENHRSRIEEHLLTLSPQDRYFRFGFSAKDEQIRAYVASLDFDRDEVCGIYNRHLRLIAMAHLA